MTGTKAAFLDAWAAETGRAFLRFDYQGHGASSGRFEACGIGDWVDDALTLIEALTEGPQILVGSSMGGWIALRIARDRPDLVAGLVGIAAAPDFTEDSMWNGFSEAEKAVLEAEGRIEIPTEYDDAPYVITRHLIEDGRQQLVLRDPLHLAAPARFLHGTADTDVEMSVALRTLEHITCEDMKLTLVKGADHRFSDDRCLAEIVRAIRELTREKL